MKRDPDKVPHYPVVNIHVTEDHQVTVDGQPVPVGTNEAPAQAGVAAVAQIAARDGLDAVRARGVAPEGEFTMVVWADGEAVDTTPEPTVAAPARRGPIVLAAIVAGVLVLAGTGTAVVVASTSGEPVAAPSATPGLPGAGANLPVLAPAGFGQKATWSLQVEDRSPVLVTPDQQILVTTTEGTVVALDGATGEVTWTGRDPVSELHLSQVDARPVVAAATSDTLYLWPMDMTDPSSVPPVELDLGARGEVSYDGSMPLIELANQTVTMFDGDQLTQRDVPIGARPVMATPDGVVAVGPDAWWRITTTDEPVRTDLPRPEAADGTPVLVQAATDTQLVVAWPTQDRTTNVVALVDLTTGTIRAELVTPADAIGRENDDPVRDAAGTTMTLGHILVDHGPDPLLADLGDIEVSALNDRTAYGTATRRPAAVQWTDQGPTSLPVPDLPGDVVAPAAVTDQHAYVLTEKVGQTLLYALPRTEGTNP